MSSSSSTSPSARTRQCSRGRQVAQPRLELLQPLHDDALPRGVAQRQPRAEAVGAQLHELLGELGGAVHLAQLAGRRDAERRGAARRLGRGGLGEQRLLLLEPAELPRLVVDLLLDLRPLQSLARQLLRGGDGG